MKPDEVLLMTELARMQLPDCVRPNKYAFATDVGALLDIHPKRTNYLLLKWTDMGWWDYGVSARTGWLTAKGLEKANELQNRPV